MSKKMCIISFFLFLIVLVDPGKGHSILAQKNLSEMVSEADSILRGKVLRLESHWTADKKTIVTDVTIAVERYIKSPLGTKEIVIQIPGGEVGEIGLRVSDVPSFMADEEVIIFLKWDGIAHWAIHHWAQGKYTIKDGTVQELDLPIDAFISKIEEILSGQ